MQSPRTKVLSKFNFFRFMVRFQNILTLLGLVRQYKPYCCPSIITQGHFHLSFLKIHEILFIISATLFLVLQCIQREIVNNLKSLVINIIISIFINLQCFTCHLPFSFLRKSQNFSAVCSGNLISSRWGRLII